jgi:predicted amidohydrolase YtcJ
VSPYGPCWTGFAQMRQPYLDPYGQPTGGRVMVQPDKLEEAVRFCHEADVRLKIVASGNAEIDDDLQLLEQLGDAPLTADGRPWILQQFYFADPTLVARAARSVDRTPLIGPPATRAGVGWSASSGPRTRRG